MSDKNGGPAFPTEGVVCRDGILYEGMTLRDYFAAKAMDGILASGDYSSYAAVAKDAWNFADAMLRARKDD